MSEPLKRRAFFARLAGAALATAVAPKILEAVQVSESQTLAPLAPDAEFVGYIASDGPNVWVGSFAAPATTGTQTIAGCPFSPSSVILYPGHPNASVASLGTNSFTVDWMRADASRQ